MADRVIPLPFPVGGLNRKAAYRYGEKLSSPDLLNVRSFGPFEERERGGQRPGVSRVFMEELGSGNPVRLLDQVTVVDSTGAGRPYAWTDVFDRNGGDLGGGWSTAGWLESSLASDKDQAGHALPSGYGLCGNVRTDIPIDTSSDYRVSLRLRRGSGKDVSGIYELYARMDATTPDVLDSGVLCRLELDADGDYSGKLFDYDSGALQDVWDLSTGTLSELYGILTLKVSGNDVSVELNGTEIKTAEAVTAHTGDAVGFAVQAGGEHVTSEIAGGTNDAFFAWHEGPEPGPDGLENNDTIDVGEHSYPQDGGIRFPLNVPRNARILAAHVELHAGNSKTNQYGDVNLVIRTSTAADAAQITDLTGYFDTTWSDAHISWTAPAEWDEYHWYNTPDIASLVQAVVQGEGWESGNHLYVLLEDDWDDPSGESYQIDVRRTLGSYAVRSRLVVFYTASPNLAHVDMFRVSGQRAAGGARQRRTVLVASSNGVLYEEDVPGQMTAVGGALGLNADEPVRAAERGQKLFIADHGPKAAEGADGTIDATGLELDAASVADWTALGIDTDDMVVVISDGDGSVNDGTYEIDSVAAGQVTLASSAGGSGNCSYVVARHPKVYDPSAGTLALWRATSGGVVPTGCQLVCLYRDRLVLSGDEDDPHEFYMSKSGDPYDFEYGAYTTEATRPIYGGASDAGKVGDVITALIPYSDEWLVFGCANSVYVMKGDPAYGGTLQDMTHKTGVIGGDAWCFGPGGDVFFVGTDGVYMMQSGGSVPRNISDGKLPAEFDDLTTETHYIMLAWDAEHSGLYVFVTPHDSYESTGYYYSLRAQTWWKDERPAGHGPAAVHQYVTQDPLTGGILLAGRDGYIRSIDQLTPNDDATAIDSYVVYPPFRTGPETKEGMVAEIIAVLAADSDAVDWEVRCGDGHEEAVKATARVSGTWSAGGPRPKVRPRARGGAAAIKVGNDAADQWWSVEKLLVRNRPLGALRV